MSKGKGQGKLILFGEHFVVYGLPGIASKIDLSLEATIEDNSSQGIIIEDQIFQEKFNLIESPEHIFSRIFSSMFPEYLNNDFNITIKGDLIPMKGLGYSSALCTAITKGMDEHYSLNLSNDEIYSRILKGESISHQNSSGIDQACSLNDNPIWFRKVFSRPTINEIEKYQDICLVVIDSSKKSSTKDCVEYVKEYKESNPSTFYDICQQYHIIANKAKKSIQQSDIVNIGVLMNQNQGLLRAIGVSCPEIEEIIQLAHNNNALGAKLSGSGMGGVVYALTKDYQEQEKLYNVFRKQEKDCYKVTI
jgi:mevalonate kinase